MREPAKLEKSAEIGERGSGIQIDLLDLLIAISRHKRLVLGWPVAAGGLMVAISFLMTPVFTSTVRMLPPQSQSPNMTSMLGQLGGFAGAASNLAGLKNPNDLYVGMLKSRTIADLLIQRFSLTSRYKTETMDDARSLLQSVTDIDSGKLDGLIVLSVTDEDPKFAAALANAYFDELAKLTQRMAVTDASMRRAFIERQLLETKDKLANAEVALRMTQEKTGLIQPEGQVQAVIASDAQLKAAIAAKEVQLRAMRSFATEQNPDYFRAREELRGLQAQLAKQGEKPEAPGSLVVGKGKIAQSSIEYIRSLREVKYHEVMFEQLSKQYEAAKADEAKESTSVQVLDTAVPAERRSRPKRLLMGLIGALGGAALGILVALLIEIQNYIRRDPASVARWRELADEWRIRGGAK